MADAPPAPAAEPAVVHRQARVSTGWSLPVADAAGPDRTGGARPGTWLGAPAPGGLALPSAMPSASQMYGPRGVWLDDRRLIVADSGNHRVLIWHDPRPGSHAPADVVLGQPSFASEGAQAGGRGPERGMRLPTGVLVHEGRLVVADAWNHRLLIWDEVPAVSDVAPDVIVGQAGPADVDENGGGPCRPTGFWWPFGLAVVAGRLWVADTGNRRVLGWDGIPEPGQAPTVVLGQPDGCSREENRGRLGADSFRWPHDLAGTADRLLVADAGNHRLLGWSPPPDGDGPADQVWGQPDFATADELPYAPQSGATLRFPYALALDEGGGPGGEGLLAVADTANNRVLVWDGLPAASGEPASRVLGQFDFAAVGENRWELVAPDTFCWPYGLSLHGGRLAVADSGNNRVMVWSLGP